MTSYEFSISNEYLNRATQTTLSAPKKLRSGKETRPEAHDPVEIESVAATHYKNDFSKIQKINDTFNTVASNIRLTNTALDSIGKKIDQMHDQLNTHVKNFPPFLPGSEERVKFLKSFNTFRKQIDSMTFPPDYEVAKKIMADPAVVPGAGDWEIVVGKNGLQKIIHSKELHTGPTGLDIPALPEDADDSTLETAIVGMENTKTTLKRLKGDLSRNISEIAQFKNRITQMDDLPASSAKPESINVRRALANIPGMSLTTEPSNLIKLLDS